MLHFPRFDVALESQKKAPVVIGGVKIGVPAAFANGFIETD